MLTTLPGNLARTISSARRWDMPDSPCSCGGAAFWGPFPFWAMKLFWATPASGRIAQHSTAVVSTLLRTDINAFGLTTELPITTGYCNRSVNRLHINSYTNLVARIIIHAHGILFAMETVAYLITHQALLFPIVVGSLTALDDFIILTIPPIAGNYITSYGVAQHRSNHGSHALVRLVVPHGIADGTADDRPEDGGRTTLRLSAAHGDLLVPAVLIRRGHFHDRVDRSRLDDLRISIGRIRLHLHRQYAGSGDHHSRAASEHSHCRFFVIHFHVLPLLPSPHRSQGEMS